MIVAMLFVAVLASAQAAAGAVRVDLLSAAKDTAPGEVATHVFGVSHDSASAQTFVLSYDVPAGWTLLGAPPEVTAAAGEQGVVSVTLIVPADAAAGSYPISLRATSETDPEDQASAGVATRVAVVSQIELVSPAGKSVTPGESISYDVLIINRGNAQDVFAFTVASSRSYALSLSTTSLELSPRESRTVSIAILVPLDASPGRDVLTVRASSTLYAQVEAEVTVFTTILPPGPSAVEGSLLETLPLRVQLGVQRNEIAGTFDSRIWLATSGPVFDGTFSASCTALHPFGSGPADVIAASLLYRLDTASYAVGNVSQSLTDLVSMSCDGGSIAIDGATADVSLIAGGSGEETRFGGLLALGPEEAQVGVTYSDRRSEAAQWATWTGTAQVTPFDGWTLRGEGGLGTDNGRPGRAGFAATTIDSESYFLSASAFSVDTYFPGPRNDTAGVEVSQRLRLASLTLGLSIRQAWDNVVRDPLVPTLVSDSLGVNLSATPWDDGPTFQTTLELARRHQVELPRRDDVNALLAYGVVETEGVFPYTLTGRVTDQVDRILGTRQRTLAHTQKVGLSVDEFSLLVMLSEERVVDLTHNLVLSSAARASLAVRPQGERHEAAIEFRWEDNVFDLDASLAVHATDDLDVMFDGFARWERGDPTGARFGWSVKLDATFDVPMPFLITKGRIEGRVFIDRNANGVLDGSESPAGGTVVFVEGNEVSTDALGNFRFPPLPPALYHLSVRELPLDTGCGTPIEIQVAAGERRVVDVALAPIFTLRGAVFEDANQDGERQSQETGLAGLRVRLQREDAEAVTTTTDTHGEFVVADAAPGSYVVSLDASTLPERFTFTTPESQTVDASDEALILFGGFIRPRAITVAFRPPTANGVAMPAAPRAGEVVTFDASLSSAADGEIVSYVWDVDGDGQADSTDVATTHAFATAGHYRARLTVTDGAGNSDTQILEIDVAEAARAPIAASTAGGPLRPPVADFAYAPLSPVAGQPITFDAAASVDFDGSMARFAWDFDTDGNPDAEGETVVWAFPAPGAYDVALTVTDEAGLSDTVVYTVDVQGVPQILPPAPTAPPIAALEYAPPSPRANEPVLFSATASIDLDGRVAAYAWDFDADGAPDSTDAVTVHVFPEPGVVSVTLTVRDDAGNSDSISIEIEIR